MKEPRIVRVWAGTDGSPKKGDWREFNEDIIYKTVSMFKENQHRMVEHPRNRESSPHLV